MRLYQLVPTAQPTLNAIDSPGTKKLSDFVVLKKCPGLGAKAAADAALLVGKVQAKPVGAGM